MYLVGILGIVGHEPVITTFEVLNVITKSVLNLLKSALG